MTKTTPGAMRATPGPWEVEERVIGADIRATRTVNGLLTRIAHVAPWPNYQANARLIAACPEMLEALQALMDEYKRRMDGDYPGENLHQFQSAYKMARATISAATGEAENG